MIEHPDLDARRRLRARRRQGGPRRRRAVRLAADGRRSRPTTSTRSSRSMPTACSTCSRAATSTWCAALLASGKNVVTTRGRVPSSREPRPGAPRPGARPRARRADLDPQHRQQPRLHHRGRPARADLDPAAARPPGDRRVRRPLAARLARAALRGDGVRPAAVADFDERRLSHLRNAFGPSLQLLAEALVAAARLGRGDAARWPSPPEQIEIAAGTLAAGTRRGAADHRVGRPRRPRAAALPGQLVLQHRARSGVGAAGHRLAGLGRGRHAARREPALPGARWTRWPR